MLQAHFKSFFLLLLCCFLGSNTSFAQEKILNYDVHLIVNKDRSIHVTELIKVYASGGKIKRGITRNFPTHRSFNNRNVKTNYDILRVEKDGKKEPFLERTGGEDYVLYLGDKNVYLKPGEYTYLIEYKVPDQIGFFDEFDEIYWNAIGTEVDFVIEKASCRVTIPEGASINQETAYLGYRGQSKKDYTLTTDGNDLIYTVNRSLKPREGFTVAIGFEKGVIEEPGLFERYGTLIVIFLGLMFLIGYYVYTWMRYGVDPPTPASYPIYEAPDQLSPASVNYIFKEGYEQKSFTASVIALAIKGYIKIEEREIKGIFSNSKAYDLVRLKNADADLNKEEERLFNTFFSGGRHNVSIDGEYHSYVESAYKGHKTSLQHQHHEFIDKGHNRRLLWTPILATILIGVTSFFLFSNNPYADGVNMIAVIIFGVAALLGIILYIYLIKKPTVEKLDLKSRIKGFLMYLEMAEKDRLDLLNPPEWTPEHFEEVLPFAFALGVEHKWSENFKAMLDTAQYRPEWNNNANMYYFSSHFGNNFSRSLKGSATKPQESSGGGGSMGGGFSGGGGGGGGVGGW